MIRQLLGIAVLATVLPAGAYVDFYGYRGAIPEKDSVVRYTQKLLGQKRQFLLALILLDRISNKIKIILAFIVIHLNS